MIMKKVLFRVDHNGDYEYVHFCYIPANLYTKFKQVTGVSSPKLKDYVERWIYDDYSIRVHITTYDEVVSARNLICQRFRQGYPELFILGDNTGNPTIYGVIRMWLVQHMRIEMAKYELEGAVKNGDQN